MKRRRLAVAATAVVATLALPLVGLAGPFAVAPLRLDFAPGQNSAEFRIENQSGTPLDVQLRVFAWSQDADGKDVMTDATELVLFPRLARIPVGETQIVRVVRRLREVPTRELAFRLFAEELPIAAEEGAPVQFQLQVSVPVFVQARRQSSELVFAEATMSEASVSVSVHNQGNAHDRVNRVLVRGLDEAGKEVFAAESAGWYVLAGATTSYEVPLPLADCDRAQRLRITVEAESAPLDAEIDVDIAACAPAHNREPA